MGRRKVSFTLPICILGLEHIPKMVEQRQFSDGKEAKEMIWCKQYAWKTRSLRSLCQQICKIIIETFEKNVSQRLEGICIFFFYKRNFSA